MRPALKTALIEKCFEDKVEHAIRLSRIGPSREEYPEIA